MNGIIYILEKIAMIGAGTASLWYAYQPKTPESLLK